MCPVVLTNIPPLSLLWMVVMIGGFGFAALRGWFGWEAYRERLLYTYRRNLIWEWYPTEMLFMSKAFSRYVAPLAAVAMVFEVLRLFTGCSAGMLLCGDSVDNIAVVGFVVVLVMAGGLGRFVYLAWFDWDRLRDFLDKMAGPETLFKRGPIYWTGQKWSARLIVPIHFTAACALGVGLIVDCVAR